MKVFSLVIIVAFALFPLSAQNDFDDLFISIGELCFRNEARVINSLQKGPLQEAEGDSLIQLWDRYCGPTEASIRTRLLYDLKFNQDLDTVVPFLYWHTYLNYLSGEEILIPSLDEHLKWTQAEAARILASREWPIYEKAVLGLLASTKISEAYEFLRPKEFDDNPQVAELRELVQRKAHAAFRNIFSLSYNYFYLSNDLQANLGAMHGIALAMEIPFDRSRLGFQFGWAASEEKAYLRFDNQGVLTESDLESFIYFDSYLMYDMLAGRRSHFSAFAGFGFGQFFTDLNYINEADEEVMLGVSTFYPLVGLDYYLEVKGTQSIGIRSTFKLSNFDSNDELRSPLDGFMLQNTLYYRF